MSSASEHTMELAPVVVPVSDVDGAKSFYIDKAGFNLDVDQRRRRLSRGAADTSNALILHGTDGSPGSHWFPWLAGALRDRGYEVTVPALPRADHPDLNRYWGALRGFDFNAETVIVGHSSGATTALALLHKLPADQRVRLVVAVAGFYRDDGFNCEGLFTEAYAWEKIRAGADTIVLLWSPDDPFVVAEQTQTLADRLGVTPTVVDGCSHFSTDHGGPRFRKLPEVLDIIDAPV